MSQETNWKWIHPSLPSNTLYTVTFSDSHTLLAAGVCGTILKSTDNGDTWKIVRAGGFNHIRSMVFTDTLTGFTAGSGSEIMKTTDGGETWTVKNTGTNDLTGICFSDQATGYACGYHVILKTTNGGDTWHEIKDSIFELTSVYFLPGTDTGFVAGKNGVMLRTFDGGENWSVLNSGAFSDLNAVTFVNSSRGYAVGNNGLLLISTDGGDQWNSIFLSELNHLTSIVFSDESNGYLTTSYGELFYTPDGFNWFKRYLNIFAPMYASAAKGERCILTGIDGTIVLSDNKFAYLTRITNREKYGSFNAATFLSADHGFAVGSWLGETRDKGNTWQNISQDPNNHISGQDIFFVDSLRSFIATGEANYLKTTDGWKTWLQYSLQNAPGGSTSVFFRNADTGFIAAYSLYHSFDKGITWQVAISYDPGGSGGIDPPVFVNDVTFISSGTGFAVGTNIWKSVDGGVTWNITDLPGYFHEFNAIFFPDSLTGFVCGTSGEIYWSSDGGNSWNEQESGISVGLNSIFFHQGIGYVVGDDGAFLKTIDNGENWELQTPMTNHDLRSVYFTEENVGFIFGEYTLLRTGPYGIGIEDTEDKNETVRIYPNPTTGKCNITIPDEFKHEKELTLYIYDSQGRLVQQAAIQEAEGTYRLDIRAQAAAIYQAVLSNGSKRYSGKIVFAKGE